MAIRGPMSRLAAILAPGAFAATWRGLAVAVGGESFLASAPFAMLALLLGVATLTDLRRRIIPDWLTYPTLGWAVLLSGCAGGVGPLASLAGAGVCLLAMLVVHLSAGGGAGDVKLATAIGALLGPSRGMGALACGFVIAGVSMLSWVVWRDGPAAALATVGRSAGLPVGGSTSGPAPWDRPVPMAGFLAAGVVCIVIDLIPAAG